MPFNSGFIAVADWVTFWNACGSIKQRISDTIRATGDQAMSSIFDQDLPRTAANFSAISPLSFIERTARVYPDLPAIVHGSDRKSTRLNSSHVKISYAVFC